MNGAGGQGWTQIGELLLAFGLSALIGLEREWRQKAAGLRTHTLVGVGAALFVLVSKHGFSNIIGGNVAFDPSRVAAQVVSGIGFIGGGLIFVRGDAVRGLTTAAIVWVTAAIGMACGAGLGLLAIVATGIHFVAVFGLGAIAPRLPRSRFAISPLFVVYEDGRGTLRDVLAECSQREFAIASVDTHPSPGGSVSVALEVQGAGSVQDLALAVDDLPGVIEVTAADINARTD